MSTNDTMQEVEVTVESCKAQVKLMEDLFKLEENPQFQSVILEDYLEKEVIRLNGLLGDASIRANEKVMANVRGQQEAIALFQNHLMTIKVKGQEAAGALADYEQALANGEFDEDLDA